MAASEEWTYLVYDAGNKVVAEGTASSRAQAQAKVKRLIRDLARARAKNEKKPGPALTWPVPGSNLSR